MYKEPSLDDLLKNKSNAFEDLYTHYKDDFLMFALKFSIKKEVVTDIYQETFLSFYENLLNGKITTFTSSIKTYLFSIGKFKIYEHLRKNNKLKVIDQPVNEEITIEDLSLENEVLTEREQLVKHHFKRLGKQCQQILELFYLKSKTIDEIMILESYGNKNVVKSQKSRCLKKLKALVIA